MFSPILTLVCILQACVASAHATGYYSIISPGTVHPNSKYSVAVSVEQVVEPCQLKLTLAGSDGLEQEKTLQVYPHTMQNVHFEVPAVREGKFILRAEGISGLIFSNSSELNYADKPNYVYVQTDKATYKPGDLVQFRTIFLDDGTRPAEITKPIVIYIKDDQNNLIKQYNNVTLTKGVFSEKLQLSTYANLGSWKISVDVDRKPMKTKLFAVDKYTLPKFEVSIDAPKKIAKTNERFRFTVRAKYTFGKLVKGKALVVVKAHRTRPFINTNVYPSLHFEHGTMNYYQPQVGTGINQPINSPIATYGLYRPFPQHESLVVRIVEKIVDLNGKQFFDFDMSEFGASAAEVLKKITIIVTVEDALTGHKRNATTETEVVPYSVVIDAPPAYFNCEVPDSVYKYLVSVRNLVDEPISDSKEPVEFSENNIGQSNAAVIKSYLNKNGVASFDLKCPDANEVHKTYKVQYKDRSAYPNIQFSNTETQTYLNFEAKMLSLHPKAGENTEFVVRSAKVLPTSFNYAIVANGNIVSGGVVTLPSEGVKQHLFKIRATHDMVPQAILYIYYIEHGDFKFHESSFEIKAEFLNKISIEAPIQTKPGEKILLKVNTAPNSFVGILGVDQSVLLLKTDSDLNAEQIRNNLHKLETRSSLPYESDDRYPGAQTGLVIMTNAHYAFRKKEKMFLEPVYYAQFRHRVPNLRITSTASATQRLGFVAPAGALGFGTAFNSPIPLASPPPPRVRNQFLETWFFEDLLSSDADGLLVTKRVPDTITSWIVTGFSLNSQHGFGLTEAPITIQTFRPFFMATNLPYSVKRGELVSIPILVFNYMDRDIEAEVTLSNDDEEFEFGEPATEPEHQGKRIKRVSVTPNDPQTVLFKIRPKKMGHITLKIKAVSPLAGDAIHKELKVEPEGVTVFKNHDYYLQVNAEHGSEKLVKLDIPEHIVAGSEHIEVSVMGDILGSTVENLDGLVRMPYGCGEQNMVNFVPNILVLRYMESTDQIDPSIWSKAKQHVEIGYQRELNYKHDDGSYSAFGKADASGSTWLTAYVVRSFHQAAKYIDIDPMLLEGGLQFLASKQADNGCFQEYGKLLDFTHQNDVGLTAFVLLTFLENEELVDKYSDVIDRGFNYLKENIKATDNLYALSVAVYALQLRNLEITDDLIEQINARGKTSNEHRWWTKAAGPVVDTRQWWRPKSHDVEITGYILMTLLERNEPVVAIAKWLIAQRNSKGGFASTQETVVGLQALIKFAEKSGAANPHLAIEIKSSDGAASSGKFVVNRQNSLTKQTLELDRSVRTVEFQGTGVGVVILQVSYQYNVVDKEQKPSFNLSTKRNRETPNGKLKLEVCTEFVPSDDESNNINSNMVVMEINLPSGYTALSESFDKIKEVKNVKLVETKNEDTNIIVYFDSLTASTVKCIPLEAERLYEVTDQKPVPIVVYDYYDNQKRGAEFYEIEHL